MAKPVGLSRLRFVYPHHMVRRVSLVGILAVALILNHTPLLPLPALSIDGATPYELMTVRRGWSILRGGFPAARPCLIPVTVRVVDRAEDEYHGPSTSITAFYRPPDLIVVEHGEVKPEVVVHEFAHHMDESCGFVRAAFLTAEGMVGRSWNGGQSWSDIPAERFAEGVLVYLGIPGAKIDVGEAGVGVIAEWAAPHETPIKNPAG